MTSPTPIRLNIQLFQQLLEKADFVFCALWCYCSINLQRFDNLHLFMERSKNPLITLILISQLILDTGNSQGGKLQTFTCESKQSLCSLSTGVRVC